ncbi:hypothetical protein Tco_0079274 [Tanacetum coccineum]
MADKEKKSTMKGFATNDQADYYSGITSITVNGKNAYELKGKFLDDLHDNAFSGTNGEDAVEHIEYFLKIVNPIDLPNVNQDKLSVVVFPSSFEDAWRCFDEIKGLITRFKTYDEYKDDWIYEWNKNVPLVHEKPRWRAYIVGNTLRYQDLEWYDALKDSELKEEALRNKAIIERLINKDVESNDEDDERHELCGNETHELSVCNIRIFDMIKYSFGQGEEYVAVKENEYEDLTSTSEDACRAYQEIFRMMDEGWMVTRTE